MADSRRMFRAHATLYNRGATDALVSIVGYRPLQYRADGTPTAWEPTTADDGIWQGAVKVSPRNSDQTVLAKVGDMLSNDGWHVMSTWTFDEEEDGRSYYSADITSGATQLAAASTTEK